MSDAALKTSPYPSYSIGRLKEWLAGDSLTETQRDVVSKEVARREAVLGGDWSAMMPGERLIYIQAGGKRPE